jgi:hypothetical protein
MLLLELNVIKSIVMAVPTTAGDTGAGQGYTPARWLYYRMPLYHSCPDWVANVWSSVATMAVPFNM